MDLNTIINVDALVGLKKLGETSVDLIVTSPPYGTMRLTYIGVKPERYTEWFMPFMDEMYRVLKENGSLILNINDQCKEGERIPYPFEVVIEARKRGWKLIDTNIWAKKNGVPAAGRRRSDYFEYIFHLAKSTKPVWNVDEIRLPYAPSSIKRAKHKIQNNVSNRESRDTQEAATYKRWILNGQGAYPNNVLYFPKDQGKSHVASFHIDLPSHYIKAHSNLGDIVLDPFAGKGTTLQAAKLLGRNFLGFDIKPEHIKLAHDLYQLEIGLD